MSLGKTASNHYSYTNAPDGLNPDRSAIDHEVSGHIIRLDGAFGMGIGSDKRSEVGLGLLRRCSRERRVGVQVAWHRVYSINQAND